jgi:hypothetical protein
MRDWQQRTILLICILISSFNLIYLLIGVLGQMEMVIITGSMNLILTIWNGLVYYSQYQVYKTQRRKNKW